MGPSGAPAPAVCSPACVVGEGAGSLTAHEGRMVSGSGIEMPRNPLPAPRAPPPPPRRFLAVHTSPGASSRPSAPAPLPSPPPRLGPLNPCNTRPGFESDTPLCPPGPRRLGRLPVGQVAGGTAGNCCPPSRRGWCAKPAPSREHSHLSRGTAAAGSDSRRLKRQVRSTVVQSPRLPWRFR